MNAQAVVLTTARDPELAREFVEFLLRPECQVPSRVGADPIALGRLHRAHGKPCLDTTHLTRSPGAWSCPGP